MPFPKSWDSGLRQILEQEAATEDIAKIAEYLQEHLGKRITAYLSGVRNTKAVGRWTSRIVKPRNLPNVRLRKAYQAARLLVETYDDETARAWFFGSNALLDDEAPAYVLRYGTTPDDLRLIVPAAWRAL